MSDDQPTRRLAGRARTGDPEHPDHPANTPTPSKPGPRAPSPADLQSGDTLPFDGPPEPPAAKRVPEDVARGAAIGRYLVLSALGRGGMGVVYAAYDPELDRRIAVKLLRAVVDDTATAGRARMQREAQALARLSHPNVIAVHDVGTHAGTVFIAMELVDGTTLRAWQAERGWPQIVDAYIAAGRGLAAAHTAGLIHRDFKPENVLVGDDGRVRVTDFGLVRAIGEAAPLAPVDRPGPDAPVDQLRKSPTSGLGSGSQLTADGTVMGTPHYMAPEALRGATIEPTADQFAWCVALWEALYGTRPFVGTDFGALDAAMRAGPPRPPTQSEVPRRIARVLMRGLAFAPAARWPSLDALIAALERAAFRRRRALVAGGVAATLALALAGVFALGQRTSAHATSCDDAGAAAVPLWSPTVRDRVAQAFAATRAPFADTAAAEVDRAIAGWRDRWQASAVDSCRATRVTHTQSDAMLDLRAACLDRRLSEARTLTGVLADANHKLVETADEVVNAQLPDLDACNDVAVLAGTAPPPRDVVGHARQQVIEARLDRLEGQTMTGASIATAGTLVPQAIAIVDDATALGWPPLVARAKRALAGLQRELGHGKDARTTLASAVGAAKAGGDHDLEVALYLDLVEIEQRLTSSYELADDWAALAGGELTRLGGRAAARFRLDRGLGVTAYRAGRLGDARTAFTAALALIPQLAPDDPSDLIDVLTDLGLADTDDSNFKVARTELERAATLARDGLGASHPRYAAALHDLGALLYRVGDYPTALVEFTQALTLRIAAYGPDDDRVGTSEEGVGTTLLAEGKIDEAKQHLTRAIAILEARLGPDHVDVASALNEIGGAYHRAGEYAEALAINQRALKIREKALGPDHPDVAESLGNIAIELKALGQWDQVEPNYRRAIAIFEKAQGPTSLQTAITHLNLAEALRVRGKLDAAELEYTKARGPMETAFGAEHPAMGNIWNGLGQVELARGHAAAAVPQLEHAVALREHDDGNLPDLAESRFALARALLAAAPADPVAHDRAHVAATAARAEYLRAGAGFAKQVAAIDAWLHAN